MTAVTQQLGLSRSTLLSLLTICTALAMFATGATFALTGSDTATGSVTSGTFAIEIDVFGAGASGALAFTTGAVSCPTNLQPGQFCTATVSVKNNGSFPINLGIPSTTPSGTASTTDVAPAGCTDAHWPVEIDTTANPYDSVLAAGATTTFLVKVTLDAAAPLGCQNETATVTVTVGAAT